MRVFITGAAGFIGQATTRELIANGHEVVGLARNDANAGTLKKLGAAVHRGSLEDVESLKRAAKDADGVIHLAFIHDFTKFAENGQIDKRAIEAMGEALEGTNKPFVVTSGTGFLAPGRLATEDDVSPADKGVPRVSEAAAFAFADRGVRVSAIRLPQVHGGEGKAGFVGYLYEVARQKRVSGYVGDGRERWPSAHRSDVAVLYRLALEKGRAGAAYHAVAEEGVATRAMAEVFAKVLNVPLVSIKPEDAQAHFGFIAMFAGLDIPASSAKTRAELGWTPKEIGLIEDISRPGYWPA
ncbi:MAG: SDR family oxidoreductase [Proteobacteria bacterium]|nr:SDR family oxidoreductase [Pseudomonadota bacterium]